MKKLFIALCLLLITATSFAAEYVSGYYRKDGTYVSPYYRSDSNGSVTDNYSFKGNYNPYTGKEGNNYYRNDPSSPYYGSSGSSGSTIWGSTSDDK
jgi:hypothetical protein